MGGALPPTERALKSGEGPFLDVGSGSAVFAAEAYARASRPLVLVDRSIGMLQAARDRIAKLAGGALPDRITLLQVDAIDLSFRSGSSLHDESFPKIMSHPGRPRPQSTQEPFRGQHLDRLLSRLRYAAAVFGGRAQFQDAPVSNCVGAERKGPRSRKKLRVQPSRGRS